MRLRLFLLISLATVSCFPGCRGRRQIATTDVVNDSAIQDRYWAGCENCNACDEGTPSSLAGPLENKSAATDQLQASTIESRVKDAVISRRRGLFGRIRRDIALPSKTLTCQSCDAQHSVLVDGMCVDCMNGSLGQQAIENMQNVKELPAQVRQELGTSRRIGIPKPGEISSAEASRELPTPAKVEQIIKSEFPANERLPKKLDITPLVSNQKDQFVPSKPTSAQTNGLPSQPKNSEQAIVEKKGLLNQREGQFESSIGDYLTEREQESANIPPEQDADNKLEPVVPQAIAEQKPDAIKENESNDVVDKNAIDIDIVPDKTIVQTTPDKGSGQAKAKSVKTGISGNAALLPNPKFETFSLEDLFAETVAPARRPKRKQNLVTDDNVQWGPPIQVDNQPDGSSKSINTNDSNRNQSPYSEPRRPRPSGTSSRSEEKVYQDLQNATVPNRIVFDNTSVIAQELIQPQQSEIVLKAKPSEYYHEIKRLAAEKKKQSRTRQDRRLEQAIPVIRAKTQLRPRHTQPVSRRQYQFNSLPSFEKVTEQSLDLGMASSIANEVFEPYEFPEAGAPVSGPTTGVSVNSTEMEIDDQSAVTPEGEINQPEDTGESQQLHVEDDLPDASSLEFLESLEPVAQFEPQEVDEKFSAELLDAIYHDSGFLFNELPSDFVSATPAENRSESRGGVPSDGLDASPMVSISAQFGEVNEFETTTDAIEFSALPTNSMRNVATDDIPGGDAKRKDSEILLKAVPYANEIKLKKLNRDAQSKAKFKFIQPNFKRVVESD